ncbi:hypothetical protein B6U90_06815 [Thermoplasmatales archaeon ex4484_6]|nr:MAG: hypothetical protein B6U90_06815 [Thermoplasmatales archaeon ex4484_6]
MLINNLLDTGWSGNGRDVMKCERLGLYLIFLTVVLWSTIEVVSKLLVHELPSMTISFLRFTLGGAFLLPLSVHQIRKGVLKNVTFRDWVSLVILSFLGITLTFALFHKALVWISATSIATLIAMVPIFSAPAGYLFLGERVTWFQVLGLSLGGFGILLIYMTEEPNWTSMLGVAIMVLAVLCFSIYSVLMKRLNRKMTARVSTPLSLFIGGILTIPLTLMDGAPLFRPLDPLGVLQIAYLGFIAVGLAYLLYFIGLESTRVAPANSLIFMKPLIAGGLAFVFLGEHLSVIRAISVVIISASILFVIREEWKRRGSSDPCISGEKID